MNVFISITSRFCIYSIKNITSKLSISLRFFKFVLTFYSWLLYLKIDIQSADIAFNIVALNIETMKIFCKFLEFLSFTMKSKFKESSFHQVIEQKHPCICVTPTWHAMTFSWGNTSACRDLCPHIGQFSFERMWDNCKRCESLHSWVREWILLSYQCKILPRVIFTEVRKQNCPGVFTGEQKGWIWSGVFIPQLHEPGWILT